MNAVLTNRPAVTELDRLGSAALDPRASLAILDKLHRGVIVIDAEARPQVMNSAATTMLLRGDALHLSGGHLVLRERRAHARLELYLGAAARNSGHPPESLVMRLERGAEPAYRLLLLPLELPTEPAIDEPALHAIFIYEPHSGRFIPTRVLTELYALTPAEARLTAELFQGTTLECAAGRLGIAISTARSHLKHVFAKCAVQTQGELLQLLALGPRTC